MATNRRHLHSIHDTSILHVCVRLRVIFTLLLSLAGLNCFHTFFHFNFIFFSINAFITIGVNISERKSGTEDEKARVGIFPTPGDATGTVVGLHRLDATPILPELRYPGIHIFIPGPTRPGLSRSLTNMQNTFTNRWHDQIVTIYSVDFAERISFAEHWKQVAESTKSSEFNLMLSRAHRVHFFQLKICKQKRDILSEKRDGAKKA